MASGAGWKSRGSALFRCRARRNCRRGSDIRDYVQFSGFSAEAQADILATLENLYNNSSSGTARDTLDKIRAIRAVGESEILSVQPKDDAGDRGVTQPDFRRYLSRSKDGRKLLSWQGVPFGG